MMAFHPFGIPVLIIGLIILGFAGHLSLTVWYLLAGLLTVLAGALLAVFGKPAS